MDVMEAARLVAATQRFAVAGMLGTAAAVKVAGGGLRTGDLGPAFDAVLRASGLPVSARIAGRLVVLAEAGVTAALLVPGVSRPASLAAAVLAAGFVGFLLAAARIAPEVPCGCLGGREPAGVRRPVARAALLGLLALCGAAAGASSGWTLAAAHPLPVAAVLAGDTALLLRLSPEAVRLGGPLYRFAGRRRCRPGTLDGSLPALRDSRAYQRVAAMLTGQLERPADHWSEGCWHFVSVPARYAGAPATAVFAVPARAGAEDVRAAVVSDTTDETLFAHP
jgi:hypothetical protein